MNTYRGRPSWQSLKERKLSVRILHSRNEGPDKGFCGYTFKRFRIVGGRTLYVGVMSGASEQGPSLPTAGRVLATFYR